MSTYCRLCDRSFVSDLALQQHIENSSAHSFACPHCSDTYANHTALHHHITDEHYRCAVCSEHFQVAEKRRVHEHEEHLYCRIHGRSFESAGNLRAHLNSADHVSRTVKCICESRFPKLSSLLLHIEGNGCSDISPHMLSHIISLMVKSGHHLGSGSGPLFDDPATNLDLWAMQYGLSSKKGHVYWCYACDSGFLRRTLLVHHLYGPGTVQEFLFRCLTCEAGFSKGSSVLQHLESGSCKG